MQSAAQLMWVVASSSLWLAVAGIVLWLCLRKGSRISPTTRALASLLVVIQGWIWIGIPIHVEGPTPLKPLWTRPPERFEFSSLGSSRSVFQQTEIAAQAIVPSEAGKDSALPPISTSLPISATTRAFLVPCTGAGLTAIWLSGITLLLIRSICSFAALSRMVHALPQAPSEWQEELAPLCGQQSILPPVLKISNVASPMLVQTWERVFIVIPAWLWESCSSEQRTSILLHELAHYRRGDIWRQLAMRLLVLPHWFNPVAWWAARQFEAANEAACDDAACGPDPRRAIAYSQALLVLNERAGLRYAHALAISGSSLSERIRRVLHPEFHKESQMSRFLILSALVFMVILASIRIQATSHVHAAENQAAKEDPPVGASITSLIANGGFEEAQENSSDPQGWFGTRIPQTTGHFLLSASATVAHGGKRSVAVAIGDNHPSLKVAYNWTAEVHGWRAGDAYELSGWIKVENARHPAFLVAQCWDEDRQRIVGFATTQTKFPVSGTTDWTRVSTRLWVPEGTASVRIRAGLSSQNNLGAKAWFDDLSLVSVTPSASESKQSEPTRHDSAAASLLSLVSNGSFEEAQENSSDPQAWFGTRIPHTAGHFQLSSSSVAQSGKRSVMVQIGDSHPDSPVHYNWTTLANGCKPGETYELSGWIKVENAKSPAFLMAQCISEDGKRIIGYSQKPCHVTGTTDWTRVSTLLKVPEGTGSVRIRAGLTSQGNPGAKAWLDDISLVKVKTDTN